MYYAGRKFFILLGLVFGIFGILVVTHPAWYSSYLNQYVDLTLVKWQVGVFFIGFGAQFIWSSFRRGAIEAEKKYKDMQKVLMCPRCVKPHQKKNVIELKCPVCAETLEDLTGFYERHPDLK